LFAPLALAAAAAFAPAHAAMFTFDVAGIDSHDVRDASGNATFSRFVGAGAYITGFSWNVNVTAFDPSWLTELTVDFTNTLGEGGEFSPTPDAYESGTQSFSGSIDLVNSGLGFRLGGDGQLHLQFHDSYDDLIGAADGRWNSGTLTFEYTAAVPEPSTYAMLALGLLAVAGMRLRGRRQSAG
jgi:hypothetical protein